MEFNIAKIIDGVFVGNNTALNVYIFLLRILILYLITKFLILLYGHRNNAILSCKEFKKFIFINNKMLLLFIK